MVFLLFNQTGLGAIDAVVAVEHDDGQGFGEGRLVVISAEAGEGFPAANHEQAHSFGDSFGERIELVGREIVGRVIAYYDGPAIRANKSGWKFFVGRQIVKGDIVSVHDTGEI